tara:strand:+ start:2285 stop:2893 length:609 start_codon:yes stop_codon:yes gene_type:complete
MQVFKFKNGQVGNEMTQLFQNYGKKVVQYARSILTKRNRNTKKKSLYDNLSYEVNFDSKKNTYTVGIDVGGSDDYWAFVESGVAGRERTQSNVGKNADVLDLPKFKFRSKNLARGVVAGWIENKPIRLRGADGKYQAKTESNIKSASFLIGRAIASRGLPYSGFLSTPILTQDKTLTQDLANAFQKDLTKYFDYELENTFNK